MKDILCYREKGFAVGLAALLLATGLLGIANGPEKALASEGCRVPVVVYDDTNSNGFRDPNEPGVTNVEVEIPEGFPNKLVTDEFGKGMFLVDDSFPPVRYSVKVKPPSGKEVEGENPVIANVCRQFSFGLRGLASRLYLPMIVKK